MSIRRRLTLMLSTALLLLVGVVGVLLYGYVRVALGRQFDEALRTKAQALGSLLRVSDSAQVEFDFSDEAMPEFEPSRTPEYFELFHATGGVVERSNSLGGRDLPAPIPAPGAGPVYADLRLPDGRAGREIATWLSPSRGEDDDGPEPMPTGSTRHERFVLIVACQRESLDRTLAAIAISGAVGGGLLALGVAILVPWFVLKNLKPLKTISEQVTRVDVTALDTRLNEVDVPAELRPICIRLNELLDRLQAGFAREQRFSADVAHELRTPVAELRLVSELATKFPFNEAEAKRAFADVHDIAQQMGGMIDSLLELVRSERRGHSVALQPTNVAAVVEECVRRLKTRANARQIGLKVEDNTEGGPVPSHPVFLTRMVDNLLANAIEYAPEGTDVRTELANRDHGFLLTISNRAMDLAAADMVHLGEAFWRKDHARSDHNHLGLGLALVRSYARSIGAQVRWELTPEGFFRASVILDTSRGGCAERSCEARSPTPHGAPPSAGDHSPLPR